MEVGLGEGLPPCLRCRPRPSQPWELSSTSFVKVFHFRTVLATHAYLVSS